jgi:four helix bundle protein
MRSKVKQVEDLRVWQEGHTLVLGIYKLKKKFPKVEIYILVPQIIRAAISVPANIAEGFYRNTTKEFIQYLTFTLLEAPLGKLFII